LNAWPCLKSIVEQKVKPERQKLGSNPNNIPLKKRWWAYQAHRPELYARLQKMQRTLCISRHTEFVAFAFLPSSIVFSEAIVVIADESDHLFAVLSSRTHETWARFLGSKIGLTLRYTPSDCFETFPFPEKFETDANLEAAGKEYYEFRAALMVKNNEGLTKTYNRFHDPGETTPEIQKLRTLHAAMDRAVLDAYGWTDLKPTFEFLLDYEEDDDDEDETGKANKKKKPWRYRWPDEFRDTVLARLLELNKERAEQERLSGEAAELKPEKVKVKRGPGKKKAKNETPDMFAGMEPGDQAAGGD
jgi:hypothetical protein